MQHPVLIWEVKQHIQDQHNANKAVAVSATYKNFRDSNCALPRRSEIKIGCVQPPYIKGIVYNTLKHTVFLKVYGSKLTKIKRDGAKLPILIFNKIFYNL